MDHSHGHGSTFQHRSGMSGILILTVINPLKCFMGIVLNEQLKQTV
jgi:hypothetical protein